MRTSPTELPTYEELVSLLADEEVRLLPKEKENIHFGDFTTIINLLKSYNLPTKFFEEDITFGDLSDDIFFSEICKMFDDLVKAILDTQNKEVQQLHFNKLYEYLSEEDQIQEADLIFVFGSKSTIRTEKAIELYKQGFAPRLCISGRSPFYEKDNVSISEAETLGEFAKKQGILEKDLILEKNSISVPDNVKRSLNLLEKESIPHNRIILVNSPFSQRRGWTHFSKMIHPGTYLIRRNANVSEQYSKDGWFRNEAGVKVVVKEFFGLRVSSLINTS